MSTKRKKPEPKPTPDMSVPAIDKSETLARDADVWSSHLVANRRPPFFASLPACPVCGTQAPQGSAVCAVDGHRFEVTA